MIITKNGDVYADDEAIQINGIIGIKEMYSVRVLKETKGNPNKKLLGEVEYEEFPSDAQILYCVNRFNGDSASIVKVYRPFKR